MSKLHKARTPFLLLTLGLLSACGSGPAEPTATSSALGAQGKAATTLTLFTSSTSTTTLPKSYTYVHTLTITSSVTQASLQTSYGGYVVAYRPAQGSATSPTTPRSRTPDDNAATEANTKKFKVSEQGMGVWSTGYGAWFDGLRSLVHRLRRLVHRHHHVGDHLQRQHSAVECRQPQPGPGAGAGTGPGRQGSGP